MTIKMLQLLKVYIPLIKIRLLRIIHSPLMQHNPAQLSMNDKKTNSLEDKFGKIFKDSIIDITKGLIFITFTDEFYLGGSTIPAPRRRSIKPSQTIEDQTRTECYCEPDYIIFICWTHRRLIHRIKAIKAIKAI